jgi:hypothetical protein
MTIIYQSKSAWIGVYSFLFGEGPLLSCHKKNL